VPLEVQARVHVGIEHAVEKLLELRRVFGLGVALGDDLGEGRLIDDVAAPHLEPGLDPRRQSGELELHGCVVGR